MSLSRRQLLRVAGTGAAVGLAGCTVGGSGKTPAPGVQAEASVNAGMSRDGQPYVLVRWLVNRDARYLTVTVENATTGDTAETSLCGVGALVQWVGTGGQPTTNGPVGDPPDCQKGSPTGLQFGPGDDLSVSVVADLGGGDTEEIVSRNVRIPTPTPTPTPTGDSSSSG